MFVARWLDNLPNRQVKLSGKLEIPLVVGWNSLDRSRAVPKQNIIRDPDRNFFLVSRIDRERTSKYARFFLRKFGAFKIAFAASALTIIANGGPLLLGHDLFDKRMLRRKHHVSGAVKRVWTRCEYTNSLFALVDLEIDLRAN